MTFATKKGDLGVETTAEFLKELSPEEQELFVEYAHFFSYGQSEEELKKRINLLRENPHEFIAYLPALRQIQTEVDEESELEKHKGAALALIHDSENSDVLSKLSRHESSLRNAIARNLNQLFLLRESRERMEAGAPSVPRKRSAELTDHHLTESPSPKREAADSSPASNNSER
jgi:hypothetical protein